MQYKIAQVAPRAAELTHADLMDAEVHAVRVLVRVLAARVVVARGLAKCLRL